MPDAAIALNTLLGLPDEGASRAMLSIGLPQEDRDYMTSAVQAIKHLTLGGVEKQIFQGFSDLFNDDLFDLISKAWEKYDVLSEYGKKKSPEQIASVELVDHTMTIELHPYLEIMFAASPRPILIHFDVSLNLTLKGLILNIENAVIKSVSAGTCEGEAEIQINKIRVPRKPSFGPIQLPGKVKLGQGIAIP